MTEVFAHLLPVVVLEMLVFVAASTLCLSSVITGCDADYTADVGSADSHKLAHKFYGHLCLNTFPIEFFCSRLGS